MTQHYEKELEYLSRVPLALGLERLAEAALFEKNSFAQPVLDLGCGDGLFARLAFDDSLSFGLDPNARELKVSGSSSGPYQSVLQALGSDIPLPSSSVGTVVSNSVLEHIREVQAVITEVHRILRPSGAFIVTVPSDRFEHFGAIARVLGSLGFHAAQQRWRKLYNSFWRHHHAYSRESWCEIFESAGFEITESHTYNPGQACLRNDMLAAFGAPGKLQKLIFNRWIFLPSLRRLLLQPFIRSLVIAARKNSGPTLEGGLVYIAARKRVE